MRGNLTRRAPLPSGWPSTRGWSEPRRSGGCSVARFAGLGSISAVFSPKRTSLRERLLSRRSMAGGPR